MKLPRCRDRLAPLVILLGALACGGVSGDRPQTIVLVSLDTLRPDRLGAYGNTLDVSPAFDALAKRGVVFEDALAPAPWTLPSHMTMLTGLDPVAHGVRGQGDALGHGVRLVTERLSAAGYATAGFTDGGFLDRRHGFARGFDRYEDERAAGGVNGFRRFSGELLAWMEEQQDSPYFLFVHTLDAHAPYQRTDPAVLEQFRKRPQPAGPDDHWLSTTRHMTFERKMGIHRYARLSQLLNDYDAGVHVADRGLGQVLALLERTGRLEDALVIVTSDHGESFLDRGPWIGHGLGLTADEIAIPLLVKFPGDEGAGRRISRWVDLLDVVPTILDVAGIEGEKPLEGESLRRLVRGEARGREESFGESANTGAFYLVRDGFKYVTASRDDPMTIATTHIGPRTPPALDADARGERYRMGGVGDSTPLYYDREKDPLGLADVWRREPLLVDRAADPRERRDLHAAQPDRAKALRARLVRRLARSAAQREASQTAQATALGSTERAALEALGYLGPAGSAVGDQLPADPIEPAEPLPDMAALIEVDREVHALRSRSRGTRSSESASDAATVERALRAYERWALEHPGARWRAIWRKRELLVFAEAVGLDVGELTTGAQRAKPGLPPVR